MHQDYDSIYQKLQPAIEQLEAQRLQLEARGKLFSRIAGGSCLLIGIILIFTMGFHWIIVIFSLTTGLIVVVACMSTQEKKMIPAYKKDIISTIINSLCPNSIYTPEEGIPEAIFRASSLFTLPDRYHSEDLIKGKIDKTIFWCSEVVAEKEEIKLSSKGSARKELVDIFRGFLFIADFHKDFKGQTSILRNGQYNYAGFSQAVKLEDPEFERYFDVYSSDQVEARYLITPAFMERLMKLDQKFPKGITVNFLYSRVIIAIPHLDYLIDHFEPNIYLSLKEPNSLKEEFDTLSLLFGIVDDLNLNLRIWSKE